MRVLGNRIAIFIKTPGDPPKKITLFHQNPHGSWSRGVLFAACMRVLVKKGSQKKDPPEKTNFLIKTRMVAGPGGSFLQPVCGF